MILTIFGQILGFHPLVLIHPAAVRGSCLGRGVNSLADSWAPDHRWEGGSIPHAGDKKVPVQPGCFHFTRNHLLKKNSNQDKGSK